MNQPSIVSPASLTPVNSNQQTNQPGGTVTIQLTQVGQQLTQVNQQLSQAKLLSNNQTETNNITLAPALAVIIPSNLSSVPTINQPKTLNISQF
jgi:hypothetical protein